MKIIILELKEKRLFQCDSFENPYFNINGKCFSSSSELNFENCDILEKDLNDEYICNNCSKYYILNEFGFCEKCYVTKAEITINA